MLLVLDPQVLRSTAAASRRPSRNSRPALVRYRNAPRPSATSANTRRMKIEAGSMSANVPAGQAAGKRRHRSTRWPRRVAAPVRSCSVLDAVARVANGAAMRTSLEATSRSAAARPAWRASRVAVRGVGAVDLVAVHARAGALRRCLRRRGRGGGGPARRRRAPWRLLDPRRLTAVVRLVLETLVRIVRANLALAYRIWSPVGHWRAGW